MTPTKSLSDLDILRASQTHASGRQAAKTLGIPRTTYQDRLTAIRSRIQDVITTVSDVRKEPRPHKGVKRFIFTAAQSGAPIHARFFANLLLFAKHKKAEIVIGGFTYGRPKKDEDGELVYDALISDMVDNTPIEIGRVVRFCPEVPITPTAVSPLSGLEGYTHAQWSIFLHPKVQLSSVPVPMTSDPKQIMTTGCITRPRYSPTKAGLKANFHHIYGAVLVEIDEEGDFFCRQLIADRDGSFQDLDVYVQDEALYTGIAAEAIIWGDVHTDQLDDNVAYGSWGVCSDDNGYWYDMQDNECLLERLAPAYQVFHDTLDFRRRNHHNIGDPHFRYKMHVQGTDSVEDEIAQAATFLDATKRAWSKSIVIDSNHDRALTRWLKQADYRIDPINAEFFLRCQAAMYKAIKGGDEDFNIVQWAMSNAQTGLSLDDIRFLKETDSFTVADGRVECGIHGDKGINGAKGSLRGFARASAKMNIADKHAAGIFDGVYMAGHSSMRDMHYNRGGMTTWSHSHVVVYATGKRAIITMRGHKYAC